MVDKVVKRANQTRKNWYDAFKMGLSIKGYEYYQPPAEIRYRYPAPGSVNLDDSSYPHLFKKHWKTPFRDSHFNIRVKEKQLTMEENTQHHISALVEFDPVTEPHYAGQQKPEVDDLEIVGDHGPLDSEESLKELWAEFDDTPQVMFKMNRDYTHAHNDLDHEYNHVQV